MSKLQKAPWGKGLHLLHTVSLPMAHHTCDRVLTILSTFPFIFVINLVIYIWFFFLFSLPSCTLLQQFSSRPIMNTCFLRHSTFSSHFSALKAFPSVWNMLSISVWDPPFVLPIHCDLRFEAFFNFPRAALHVFFSVLPEDSVNYFIIGLIILPFNEMEHSLGPEPCLFMLVFRSDIGALTS